MAEALDPDMQAARADLAFLRALAEDKDPLAALYGWHLIAIGLFFGPVVLFTWAGVAGLIDVPDAWTNWSWVPASVVYLPMLGWLLWRGAQGPKGGPTQRAVWYAWAAVGMMTAAILIGLVGASAQVNPVLMVVWPSIALALYGGVWTLTAFVRGVKWHGLVALGCYLFSIASAWSATTPAQWFFLGLGLLLFLAGPGVAIVLKARATA